MRGPKPKPESEKLVSVYTRLHPSVIALIKDYSDKSLYSNMAAILNEWAKKEANK